MICQPSMGDLGGTVWRSQAVIACDLPGRPTAPVGRATGQQVHSRAVFVRLALLGALACGSQPACRCDANGTARTMAEVSAERPAALLFPEALQVTDPSVNAFITRAMTVCAARKYDDFRLLWSAAADPMPRDEFEYGWQAVQSIRILAVEKARLESKPESPGTTSPKTTPPVVYVLFAEVKLDPGHRVARDRPDREVILMVMREHDQWRLAHALRPMRAWIRTKVEQAGTPTPSLPIQTVYDGKEDPG